ncbi:hypothetical protein SPBRAN_1291 [uncultured Candidatus Thioglobus sp.]|nr:hypothetical protein SPBRAN_1291 [uncultured Candidatus Thioglobus sp.]
MIEMTIIAGGIIFFLDSSINQNMLAFGVFVISILIILVTQIINNNNKKIKTLSETPINNSVDRNNLKALISCATTLI